jgi:hypothetical protein
MKAAGGRIAQQRTMRGLPVPMLPVAAPPFGETISPTRKYEI